MKSINWVVNGVLAIAVIVLYVLHFNNTDTPIKSTAANGAGTKVAYFEIDSILNFRKKQWNLIFQIVYCGGLCLL